LAGRLSTSSDGVVYIDCNNGGVDFIEVVAPDVDIQEITEAKVGPLVRQLFMFDGASNLNGHFLPLLVDQRIYFSNSPDMLVEEKSPPYHQHGRFSLGSIRGPGTMSRHFFDSFQIQISQPTGRTILQWVSSSDLVLDLKLELE